MVDFDCPNCKENFIDKNFEWGEEVIKCPFCKKEYIIDYDEKFYNIPWIVCEKSA
jgi:C4-type Zn-finger protein